MIFSRVRDHKQNTYISTAFSARKKIPFFVVVVVDISIFHLMNQFYQTIKKVFSLIFTLVQPDHSYQIEKKTQCSGFNNLIIFLAYHFFLFSFFVVYHYNFSHYTTLMGLHSTYMYLNIYKFYTPLCVCCRCISVYLYLNLQCEAFFPTFHKYFIYTMIHITFFV